MRVHVSRPSFSNQVLVYGLLITLLPLTITGYFILRYERKQLLDQAERELNIVTQAIALETTAYVNELEHDAAMISKLPAIRSMNPQAQADAIPEYIDHHMRYDYLTVYDLAGTSIQSANQPVGLDQNAPPQPSFQLALNGAQAWSIDPGPSDMGLVLNILTPILASSDPQAVPVGVLSSPVSLSKLSDLLAMYDGDMPNSTFILGSDNRVLIHQNDATRASRPDFTSLVKSPDLTTGENSRTLGSSLETGNLIYIDGTGEAFITSITKIDGLDWTVVSWKRESVVLQPLQIIQLWGLAIMTLLATIAIASAFLVRNLIAKPIEDLAQAATGLERGYSNHPLPRSKDQVVEIKQLIEAFVNMRRAVTDREQQLHLFSSSLEEEVTRRTLELTEINTDLEKEISNHKKTTDALVKSRDAAEQANQAKDIFLAQMSHELRTPLNAIIGYAELLEETSQEQDLSHFELNEDAHSIKRAGRHLLAIINDVLNYSKLQAGEMKLEPSWFTLEQLINQTLIAIKPLIPRNQNELIVNKIKFEGQIYSDELKLRQILINLLSNAAKFTREGEITLKAFLHPQPSLETQQIHTNLVLTIKDTGIGIPEEQQHKLFRPFTQIEESYGRQHEGTGLGLVLTKSFTDILNGKIDFHSQVSVGTQFIVTIPILAELGYNSPHHRPSGIQQTVTVTQSGAGTDPATPTPPARD